MVLIYILNLFIKIICIGVINVKFYFQNVSKVQKQLKDRRVIREMQL